MKKLVFGIAVLLLFSITLPVSVLAVDDDEPVSTDNVTETSNPIELPSKNPEEIKSRIEKYKQKAQEKLSTVQARRIENRCSAAQKKIEQLKANVDNAIQLRSEKYDKISNKISELITKVEAAGLSVDALKLAQGNIDSQVSEVLTLAQEYSQTLADLAEMDCESDADGFKSALVEARNIRKDLVEQAIILKEFLNKDLKTALEDIKLQITESNQEEE